MMKPVPSKYDALVALFIRQWLQIHPPPNGQKLATNWFVAIGYKPV
jgi:hypothetical protein